MGKHSDQLTMRRRGLSRRLLAVLAAGLLGALPGCAARGASDGGGQASAGGGAGAPPASVDPWPRQLQLSDATALVYSPQVESWQGNQLAFRSAVAITPSGSSDKTYGVVWATARTEVDRMSRRVSLENLTLTRSKFPTLADNGAHYLSELQGQLPSAAQTIALDRLQASLAASGTVHTKGVAVQNTPPRILVSYTPAVLVPIDGQAVLRPVPGTNLQRVINTRALIVRAGSTYYLHVYDGWLQASAVDGPWSQASSTPAALPNLAQTLSASGTVDLLSGANAQPPPSLANGVPAIYIAHQPSELLVFKGQPNLQPVGNTGLLWASNTTSDVIVDTATSNYYVLLSGRWYEAQGLSGPWTYVPSNGLPAAFARIPPSSPAGVVLAAVAGTPQAKEAVIENSIPQTATIPRSGGPSFTSNIAGAPQLKPIAGTPLQYVYNSATPIIRVDAKTWYALYGGVWYEGTSAQGPWVVAATVPEVIYTIPPSSALYYVTYARVYGYTDEVVYVGYTPGYMGTVVTPDGTVVYGTGYVYPAYVGDVWVEPPVTYGIEAQPVYNPAVGYAYGFGMGLATAAVVDSWDSPAYYDTVYHGYPCCGSVSANTYGHYGDVSTSGTRTWYNNNNATGTNASGSYTNHATGTTGRYTASESYDYDSHLAKESYSRTANTTAGGSGSVSRSETYNTETCERTYDSQASATGAGGSSATRDTEAAGYGGKDSASASQTTVDNAKTGTTNTYDTARVGDNHYADVNGNVYKNTGNGWQQAGADGWKSASGDNSWADREQQARNAGGSRFGAFQSGGFANRFGDDAGRFGGGGGFGGGGDRFEGFGGGRFAGGGGHFGGGRFR
ncbi:MAG: hypothetical protein SF182_16130 [Deltaproteobacteria bacterium]|nr:hypothetical protein [Deltaproteobacteria bacterium]